MLTMKYIFIILLTACMTSRAMPPFPSTITLRALERRALNSSTLWKGVHTCAYLYSVPLNKEQGRGRKTGQKQLWDITQQNATRTNLRISNTQDIRVIKDQFRLSSTADQAAVVRSAFPTYMEKREIFKGQYFGEGITNFFLNRWFLPSVLHHRKTIHTSGLLWARDRKRLSSSAIFSFKISYLRIWSVSPLASMTWLFSRQASLSAVPARTSQHPWEK